LPELFSGDYSTLEVVRIRRPLVSRRSVKLFTQDVCMPGVSRRLLDHVHVDPPQGYLAKNRVRHNLIQHHSTNQQRRRSRITFPPRNDRLLSIGSADARRNLGREMVGMSKREQEPVHAIGSSNLDPTIVREGTLEQEVVIS
jgi:hypothetical protein